MKAFSANSLTLSIGRHSLVHTLQLITSATANQGLTGSFMMTALHLAADLFTYVGPHLDRLPAVLRNVLSPVTSLNPDGYGCPYHETGLSTALQTVSPRGGTSTTTTHYGI